MTLVSPSPPLVASKSKLEYIDALRGIAILMVIAVHALHLAGSTTAFLPGPVVAVLTNGAWGVRLFFVASAYTLFRSLHHRRQTERNELLNFYLRRFFRIAPLYYCGMLLYGAWFTYAAGQHCSWRSLGAEAIFLQGLNPYWISSLVPGGWSITVEMCFYLLVPFVARRVTSLNRAVVFLLGTVVLHALLSYGLRHHPLIAETDVWNTYLAWFLPRQLPIFALGFVFYFLSQADLRLRAHTLLAAALIVLAAFALDERLGLVPTAFALLPADLGFGVGFVLLALALSRKPFGFFVNPFTRAIGQVSFGLYVVHFFVLFALNKCGWGDLLSPTGVGSALENYALRYALVLALSYALSYLLHRLVEVPMQQVGKQVIARLEK
ncbi:acyltransferase family protein [Hymenobacter jejuensis]|uniref:Acyltransferase n=1 Tax=Hymenobacter jejuensis TaxID=2502781 RepID=A0A5B8A5I3_9BACT|nr:acyltransferase [Hymenobacter jejuensis]QDA61956.1 acyltransferase [Hymenobacter jejuensis]